ncbi:DUF1345 domain-containing protein [Nostoc sp. FACHB-888]|nr:DUF1345 domain-containing protein [Nostoc sp. FACHB-888]
MTSQVSDVQTTSPEIRRLTYYIAYYPSFSIPLF